MTDVKIDGSKLPAAVKESLAVAAKTMYEQQGGHWVGLIELGHADRNDPQVDDLKPTVKLRITQMYLAAADQEDDIRRAMAVLHTLTTAAGTLFEDAGDVELDPSSLDALAETIDMRETVKMRVALKHWARHADDAVAGLEFRNATGPEVMAELRKIRNGLANTLAIFPESDGDA